MTIWETVNTALSGLSLPMAANTYLSADNDLPDAYLVYSLVSDPTAQHADDDEVLRSYRVQVSLYNRSGLAGINPGRSEIDAAMKAAGFTRGPGREIAYNQTTRHFGLALDYYLLTEE